MTTPVSFSRDPYTFAPLPEGSITSSDGHPLPRGWSEAHVHCVAMAGARASGKSLYTAVAIKQLEELASHYNRVVEPADDSTRERYVKYYETPLYREMKHMPATPPASNADAYQREPLIFSLGRWADQDGVTRVHYDVAGEDLENLPEDPEALSFFRHADQIIFLFDPLRVQQIRTYLKGLIPHQSITGGNPEDVLRNIITIVGDDRPRLAVTISKFDTLQQLADTGDNQWADIMGNSGAAFRRDSGVQYDHSDQQLLHMEIESLLRFMHADRLVNLIGQDYSWVNGEASTAARYFAVSALGESPRGEHLSRRGIAPYRVLDPILAVLAPQGVFAEHNR